MAAPGSRTDEQLIESLLDNRRVRFAATTSRYLTWAAGGIMLLILVLWLSFFQHYRQLLAVAGCVVPMVVTAGVFPLMQRRGRPRSGMILILAGFLVGVVAIAFLMPELLPPVAMGYTLIVLVGYLFLGSNASLWLLLACAAGFALDATLPHLWNPGWFAPLPERTAWILNALTGTAALIGDGIILRQIILGQDDTFCQARRASLEIERRARTEQEQRQHLQSTVERYVVFMAEVARGDLAVQLPLDDQLGPNDPLSILARNLNLTIASLRQMTLQVRDTAANLASAAAEILAATAQQARAANEQSAAITQASATIDQVRTIADQTSQRAHAVADLSQRAADVSLSGQQAVSDTIDGVNQIKARVESIAANILSLSEQAQTIGDIITAVNQLASQSHMLALNAAVEAARAGDAGKGFAVVASEVRSLAEQSRAATTQVKDILSQIQHGVNTSVMATEEGMKGADLGVKLAAEAGEAIRRQTDSVSQASQAALQIAAAAGQQLTGVDQIAQAMQNIDQATMQSVSGARQAERAAAELNALAGQLRQLVERYQL